MDYKTSSDIRDYDDFLYVERGYEKECLDKLRFPGNIISVLAPRQSGKTSFIHRLCKKINGKDIFIDFRSMKPSEQTNRKDEKTFYTKLISLFAAYLEDTNQSISNIIDAPIKMDAFCLEIQKLSKDHVVVCFDEFDDLLYWDTSIIQQFLTGINIMSEVMNINFLICSIIPISRIYGVKPPNFKTLHPILLPDFSLNDDVIETWTELLPHLDSTAKRAFANLVFEFTSGHPLLVNKMFSYLKTNKEATIESFRNYIDEFIDANQYFKDDRDLFFGEAENVVHNSKNIKVLDAYKQALEGQYVLTIENQNLNASLFSAGLIKWSRSINETAQIRNKIFGGIYNLDWIIYHRGLFFDTHFHKAIGETEDETDYKKISILNMGGTLGMFEKNDLIDKPKKDEFEEFYASLFNHSKIDFDCALVRYDEFEIKDGANIYPEDWENLVEHIYEMRVKHGFDGFIILHGTDTLAFTASAVAFAFGRNLNFPIVFVGSQATNKAYYGDAYPNLARAIKVASLKEPIPEVVVCFNDNVFRAVRVEKDNDYMFKGFVSNTMKPLAFFSQNIEISMDDLIFPGDESIELKNKFETRILKINQTPGLHVEWYKHLLEKFEFKAVIIESLGAGNLPTKKNQPKQDIPEYEFVSLIETANEKRIPVIITSKYPIKSDYINKYHPSLQVSRAGGIWAGNLNSVSAHVKLMWLLPQIDEEFFNNSSKTIDDINKKLEEMMVNTNYIGEIDLKKIQ